MSHEEAFEAGWNAALAGVDAELYPGGLHYEPDRVLTIKTWKELQAKERENHDKVKRMALHLAGKLNVVLGLNENELAFCESLGANVIRPSNTEDQAMSEAN